MAYWTDWVRSSDISARLEAADDGRRPHHATCRLVLYGISAYVNKEGVAWPSYETLSAATGLSERRVISATNTLRKAKLVSVSKRATQRGHYVNEYKLLGPTKVQELRPAKPKANGERFMSDNQWKNEIAAQAKPGESFEQAKLRWMQERRRKNAPRMPWEHVDHGS